jgi:hypothetical protein
MLWSFKSTFIIRIVISEEMIDFVDDFTFFFLISSFKKRKSPNEKKSISTSIDIQSVSDQFKIFRKLLR